MMAMERLRVFGVIHEHARTGDPDWVWLAREFPSPDTLLNAAPAEGEGQGDENVPPKLRFRLRPG
jgi:hypothetical protein